MLEQKLNKEQKDETQLPSSPNNGNTMLYAGLGRIEVEVVKYPISDRYCSKGLICKLDTTNSQIRCSGAWFSFDDRWTVKPCV